MGASPEKSFLSFTKQTSTLTEGMYSGFTGILSTVALPSRRTVRVSMSPSLSMVSRASMGACLVRTTTSAWSPSV